MAPELRETGISVVGDVSWGTHLCHFYETKEDLLDILIPYFNTGLENNEFCVWVVSDPLGEEEAKNAFRQAVPEADRYLMKGHIEICSHSIFPSARQQTSPTGRIEIVPHIEWYLKGGAFIAEQVLDGWNEKLADALTKGYAGLRANGNEAWLTEENRKDFIQYEKTLDERLANQRMIVLCSYPLSSSSAAQVLDVVNAHQVAVIKRRGNWEVIETPEVKRAKQEIQRLNEELEQRVVERTRELAAANEELRREIAERRQAEDALRGSEERFAAFMDNLPGYAWMKDLQGRYVYVNEMVTGLPGYRSLGKTDAQIWPADLAAEYRANDQQVIARKRPLQTLEHFQQEGKQRYMAGSKFPILDKTGAVAMVGGVGVDITERIEAEAALRESEAKLKQAQQLAHIGYWERDLIADRITWSKETSHILGLESSPGMSNQAQIREFIHPDDWQYHQQVLNEALQGSRLFDVEVRIVRPDGNIRFVHIRDEIVRDESGQPIRMFGAVQDITERRRAEEAVRRSEEHLRLVIDTIPTMAWTSRPDGVVDFINQRWLDYAGVTLEQYLKDPMATVHPDDVTRVMENWGAAMMAGKPYQDEMRLQGADGEYHWFMVRSEPLRDKQGKIVKWYGSSIDIEDRKRAELEARTLINAIPDQIWSGPPDGTNDYVNARWRSETGLNLEDVRGEGWKTLLHPEDRARVLKAWQYSVQTGTPYEQEERHRTADGTYRWYLNRGVPLRDDQGRIIRWYGSNSDIEDRKQAEEKLKHSKVQLAQAQRLAHIGSWDWDLRTNVVTWSDELYRIFGLQPGTISVAGEVDRFIHPDDLELGWDTVKRAVASKEPYDFYHRILRPDGTERIARSRGSIMSDERGEPIKVFGATQDVTELKRAEEKLQATTEQLRALSASVQTAREEESKRIAREIHDELGGALTSWRWDLEEIRDEISVPLNASQVAPVRNKIEGMIKLTETTLDTVRRLASELRPAALELGLVQGLEWQALQFENRTGISVQLESVVEKVDLDNGQATAVFRILQEALTNIQRHAQATHVTITCWEESDRFILAIQDNGRGITKSEESATRSLGLLGMRERANLVGAEIKIESAAGEGTKITLQVPISARERSGTVGP